MTATNAAIQAVAALNGPPSVPEVTTDGRAEALVREAPDGTRVLLVAETDGEAATATVTVGDLPGLELLLGTAPMSACPGGELTFELGPHGVAIVRLAGGASGVPACAPSS